MSVQRFVVVEIRVFLNENLGINGTQRELSHKLRHLNDRSFSFHDLRRSNSLFDRKPWGSVGIGYTGNMTMRLLGARIRMS
ncbi:protein of unknown function [Stenotrophomonas maltophilia]|nr:protein of unknown function [Stenotrophomonas maltophilia]